MQQVSKNYSIFAHALHSRLQLIKNKIEASPDMSPQELITLNKKYFDLVAQSVDTFHHYKAGRNDYHNAAELFLATLDPNEKEIQSQPVWRPKLPNRPNK